MDFLASVLGGALPSWRKPAPSRDCLHGESLLQVGAARMTVLKAPLPRGFPSVYITRAVVNLIMLLTTCTTEHVG